MSNNFSSKPKIDNDVLTWARYSLFFVLFILILLFFFYVFGYCIVKQNENFLMKDSDFIGNTINGVLAPFIGSLAVATTFLAFYVQYQANQNQRKDIQRERFETNLFELIKIHRDNVQNLNLYDIYLKKDVFIIIFEEIKYAYCLLEKIARNYDVELSTEVKLKMTYHYVFHGLSQLANPFKKNDTIFHEKEIELKFINSLREKTNGIEMFNIQPEFLTDNYENRFSIQITTLPFRGYIDEVSLYYRHLFQTIKYIITSKVINWHEKYFYIKILRSQLTNYEQIVLFLNACWINDGIWWEDKDELDKNNKPYRYLLDFAIVKNIPFNILGQIGLSPVEIFKQKLGKGPYFIGKKEVTLEEKLDWLFEWYKPKKEKA